MEKYKILLLFLFLNLCSIKECLAENFYRVEFADKNENARLIENPSLFLSERAIQRREKYKIEVTDQDLPVSNQYLNMLSRNGKVISKSKWRNSCVIVASQQSADQINAESYIKKITYLGSTKGLKRCGKGAEFISDSFYSRKQSKGNGLFTRKNYGKSYDQIHLHKGERLHQMGYLGNGRLIAVIDAGFKGVNELTEFDQARIREVKDFGYPREEGYGREKHGTQVLSTMLANLSGSYIGTAPYADYILLRSEALSYELPVEEDFWINAVEYADSCGVDIISSSLGYQVFDQDFTIYSQKDIGQNRAISTQVANIAFEKGMIVVLSAGNERETSWGGLSFPADAQRAFTVGSIDEKKEISNFSSQGFVTDISIKPNVVSLGTAPVTIHPNGFYSREDGTSFATPIIAGLIACLWEALPEKSNIEIMKLVEGSADLYQTPNDSYGFGVPDLEKAYEMSK